MATPTATSQMQDLSAQAVRLAAEKYGKSLDYTDQSLPYFESILQQICDDYLFPQPGEEISEDELKNMSRIWGSYLGEYMRRKWGGDWIANGENFDLVINGSHHSPFEQVYHRITHGKQYDIPEYIARIASDIAKPRSILRSFSRHPVKFLSRTISRFWRSGVTAKISTIAAPLIILCCCIISLPFLFPLSSQTPSPQPPLSTQTEILTAIPSAINTQVPSPTLTSSFTPFSTASFNPTFTATFTSISNSTFTVTSTATRTLAPSATLYARFIDVGQGDSILIQTPYGQTILIDGGDTNTGIVQYLKNFGIQRIDLMIATHPHADHIGGLVQVLQTFPVVKVVTNGEAYTTSVYEQFLDAIMAAKADYVELKRGDILSQGGLDFHCLSPVAPTKSDSNENSLVLQFTYGKTIFLLMGDAGAKTESDLLGSHLFSKVDILKVGHHGSADGSTPAFLSAIKPTVAVYSAGLNNMYGNPAPQTIANLIAVGAKIFGTDQNGTVTISTDLNGYTINPTKRRTSITLPIPPTEPPTQSYTPTQTPTLALTSTQIPTLAFIPTQAPTIPAPAQLEIKSVTSPVSRNSNATLIAQTSPNARCSITVYTKSGTSGAQGLDDKNANASGIVSWTWRIGPNTTLGTWPIDVTCNNVTKRTEYEVK